MSPLPRIRWFLVALGMTLGVVASGCSTRTETLVGDGMANEPREAKSLFPDLPSGHPPIEIVPLPPDHPPIGQGGGPPSICHPDPGDLGEPSEVPEGFDEPDHSEASPAHPPHLRTPEHPTRHWEDQI